MAGLQALLRKTDPLLTVLADGAVVQALPNFDAESVATAHELGYAGDVLAMTRDHDPFHRILAEVLGTIESPALRDAANGSASTELGGAEEDVILALQRYVQLLRAKGQKVRLSRVLKYSEGQERDDKGRFSAGGAPYSQDQIAAHFADNLGIERKDMPQIPNDVKARFVAEQRTAGFAVSHENVPARSLKATQSTFNAENVNYLASQPPITGNPITASGDNRVLDGHHRWVDAAIRNKSIDVTRINRPMAGLVLAAKDFSQRNGIAARKVSLAALLRKYNPDQPREPNGRWGQMGGSEQGAAQQGGASLFPRAEPGALSPAQRAVETRFARQLGQDIPAAIQAYAALKDSGGGKILNTDVVRELSADYRANRSEMAPAVHEPASQLTKMMYAEKLAEPPVSNTVLFTAGGAGAGKSSTNDVPGMASLQSAADVVYDTNMDKYNSARTKIDQALASGRDVQIAYVARDPVEALTGGALPRAMGTSGGRVVPLSVHAATHMGAAATIQQIAAHYAGDPRVQIHYVDNSRGRGNAALSDSTLPARQNFSNLHERLNTALKAEYDAGRISAPVYHGTRGSH